MNYQPLFADRAFSKGGFHNKAASIYANENLYHTYK